MNGKLLVLAVAALLGAVTLAFIPYGQDVSASDRSGTDVDLGVSVSCPAAILGALQSEGSENDEEGWFNYVPNDGVSSGGLCRSGARWRLAAAVGAAAAGTVMMRRGLRDGADASTRSA